MEELFARNRAWAQSASRTRPRLLRPPRRASRRRNICGSAARTPACRRTRSWGWPRARCSSTATSPTWSQHTDLNCLSVLQYAIDVLKVEHVIVVRPLWLRRRARGDRTPAARPDRQLAAQRQGRPRAPQGRAGLEARPARSARTCCVEINVATQVLNVGRTTIVQNAWAQGRELTVHGWIYGVPTACCATSATRSAEPRRSASRTSSCRSGRAQNSTPSAPTIATAATIRPASLNSRQSRNSRSISARPPAISVRSSRSRTETRPEYSPAPCPDERASCSPHPARH